MNPILHCTPPLKNHKFYNGVCMNCGVLKRASDAARAEAHKIASRKSSIVNRKS